ncbi:MAG: PrgI family protein [Candidatus Kerfeldbacteria bacterium]
MQYVVPQFIEVESKIIGPISGRQFIEILVTFGLCYIWYAMFKSPFIFVPLILLSLAVGGILSFAKVNGQAMHYFLLNLIQTLRRPRLKIWERQKALAYKAVEIKEVEAVERAPVTESRLAEVSLMVDTGGAYQGDQERAPDTAVSAIPGQTPGAAADSEEEEEKKKNDKGDKIQLGF